jgi:hypothetical protein
MNYAESGNGSCDRASIMRYYSGIELAEDFAYFHGCGFGQQSLD